MSGSATSHRWALLLMVGCAGGVPSVPPDSHEAEVTELASDLPAVPADGDSAAPDEPDEPDHRHRAEPLTPPPCEPGPRVELAAGVGSLEAIDLASGPHGSLAAWADSGVVSATTPGGPAHILGDGEAVSGINLVATDGGWVVFFSRGRLSEVAQPDDVRAFVAFFDTAGDPVGEVQSLGTNLELGGGAVRGIEDDFRLWALNDTEINGEPFRRALLVTVDRLGLAGNMHSILGAHLFERMRLLRHGDFLHAPFIGTGPGRPVRFLQQPVYLQGCGLPGFPVIHLGAQGQLIAETFVGTRAVWVVTDGPASAGEIVIHETQSATTTRAPLPSVPTGLGVLAAGDDDALYLDAPQGSIVALRVDPAASEVSPAVAVDLPASPSALRASREADAWAVLSSSAGAGDLLLARLCL